MMVFSTREISEVRKPTGVKFFYNAGPKFSRTHPKKISGAKNMQISLEPMKIATTCQRRWRERSYPKSTMRVRRIQMHLSSGYVTLMPGKFYPPPNFPRSDLGRRADSRWALPQISSFFPSMRSPRCVGRPAWNFARWLVLGRIL